MFLKEDIHCFHSGNCYRILTKQQKFQDAISSCGSKGILASMKDKQEEWEILQLLSPSNGIQDTYFFWIGLSKPTGECVVEQKILKGFVWLSGGENSSLEHWESMPKKSCTSKRCVALKVGNHSLVWKDYPCKKTFASVCRSKVSWKVSSKDLAEPLKMLPPFIDKDAPDIYSEETTIIIHCGGCKGNVSLACKAEKSHFLCTNSQCSCAGLNGNRRGTEKCRERNGVSCLEECLNPAYVPPPCTLPPFTSNTVIYNRSKSPDIQVTACPCLDGGSPCQGKCTFNISFSPVNVTFTTTTLPAQSNATGPLVDDETLFERLIIPLILGLVALGILAMLLWGGIQMCVRKKKPPRKKSIVPMEPKGSETDSTDHSSSEDEDTQDKAEVP
ncbi:C-type lectin domain family 14 member A [Xenopus tropicalis]|uniref:C-type lectin domain family 14 member A n=1 Tax=Xenopus tropicalis TaxID=8364 RepID=A0A8J0QR45_XENTR|nr:C-type lectin domain family 14 member A [Xenopus tropicalis]|eukprot:XP_002935391.1 PREDICTED: C-type lectin domain family 14 member A [Xenopus tropicalis]